MTLLLACGTCTIDVANVTFFTPVDCIKICYIKEIML